MRNSNRPWRVFFWVALAFNLVAGLPLLIAPGAALAAFGVAVPGDLLFHRFTGLLVVCFGVLYALVASDAARFRPLISLGIVGKTGVILLFTQAYLSGGVPFTAYAMALGDLAFVIGFLTFLFTQRRAQT